MKFSTKTIHSGQNPEKEFGSIIPPIYMTSTYVQSSPGVYNGYDYTRAGNPNFTNLEEALADLENGKYATVFSSGLGAITALLSTLQSGDAIVAMDDLYGGTYRLFNKVYRKFGLNFEFLDMNDYKKLEEVLKDEHIKFVWIESPTNPLLKTVDISGIVRLAKKFGKKVIVDNTFATPYFQNPLDLGADIVLHSTTKYLSGHSDIIGGAVITNDLKMKEEMDFMRKAVGLNPSPFDVWLTHRGLKTLALRMKQHEENAKAVMKFLENRPEIKKVYYPGFGGMISVEFHFNLSDMKKMISSYKIFSLAESLGGVESLVDHPASMTHASLSSEERKKIGLSDGLVRYSIGIEDIQDILEDMNTGFYNVS